MTRLDFKDRQTNAIIPLLVVAVLIIAVGAGYWAFFQVPEERAAAIPEEVPIVDLFAPAASSASTAPLSPLPESPSPISTAPATSIAPVNPIAVTPPSSQEATPAPPRALSAVPTQEELFGANPPDFQVQVLAAQDPSALLSAAQQLVDLGQNPFSVRRPNGYFGLRVGASSRSEAEQLMERLRSAGFSDAWLIGP